MSKPDLQDVISSEEDRAMAFRLAIVRAREKGSPEGFVVGDMVALDGVPLQLHIKELHGDEAIVWVRGDESTVRTVPYDELIDMHVLVNETFAALTEVQFGTPDQIKH